MTDPSSEMSASPAGPVPERGRAPSGARLDTAIDDLWSTVKIYKGRALACTALLFSMVLAVVLLLPNSYRSEASVFVKLGRESVALDPTVTTTQTVTVNETREIEVNSILEVLRSRELAQRVVDEFGPQAILRGRTIDQEIETEAWPSQVSQFVESTMDALRQFNDGRVVSPRERATRRILKKLKISAPKKTTVITLRYDTQSPELAQQVLARLLDEFMQEHVRINRTLGSHDFLAEQAGVLQQKLIDAENELRLAKNNMGLVTMDGARRKLEDEIQLISQRMINAQADLSAAESRIADLQSTILALPERLKTADVAGLPNEATDRMRSTLYQLQIREKELLSRYTEENPLVVEIRRQVAEAEDIYRQQGLAREQSTTAVHPSRQQLELLLMTETANAAAFRGRIHELDQRRQVANTELITLNEHEMKIADLQRQVDIAGQSFRVYADRMEQARLDGELQSQNISNLNVLQPASYQEKPVSPPRLLTLMAGFVLAILGGLGFAFLSDLVNPVLKTADDIEHLLAVPVSVSVPRNRHQRRHPRAEPAWQDVK